MPLGKKATKSAIAIMIFTLISKLLGFLREILIASTFGLGYEADAYFIAITASTVMIGIICVALKATLIPIFSEIENKESNDYKIKYMNNILNVVVIFTILLTILGMIYSPYIIRILAKGFKGEQFDLTIQLYRIGFPMIIFISATYIFSSFLQSSEKFVAPALVGIPFNIVHIIFLILFTHKYGVKGLMITTTIAASTQLLIQIPSAYKLGYSYKFKMNIKDEYLKKVLIAIGPVVAGSMVQQINIVIDRTLASELVEGSISALNYADKLNSLVLGVFVMAITTVVFPKLSKQSSNGNTYLMKKVMDDGIKSIILFVFPISIGISVLAFPIVELLFERGAFNQRATEMTSVALIFYSLGLLGFGIRKMLNIVFYSMKDTKTPMINGIIAVGVNIILNIVFVRYMSHAGLALATSISAIVAAVLLFFSLSKSVSGIKINQYINYLIKCGLSSVVMGIIIYFTNLFLTDFWVCGSFTVKFTRLVLTSIVGVTSYFIMCYKFHIEEVRQIINKKY